jgi:phage-related protein (TIGR01555 family)
MIFGRNDGGTLDVPLNPQGIKAVDFLRVYDRWQATIQTRVTDPMSEQYGKPEMWLISPVNGGMPYKVHNSRLWVFDGDRIPDHDRAANQGWGASALQACQDQLKRLGMGHQWTLAILERAQQAVHKIPRLAQTLQAPGGEKMIQKRVDVVDMVRGILNTIVVDGDESYDVTTATLTGYTDVLDRFAEAVSAVTSIPVSILMGRSQGGLSNTDKATMDAWYARIESMWNDILRKPQDKLVQYIMIAKNGEAPDYKLCMRPLSVLSATEQAEVDYKQAQAFKARAEGEIALITANVLDPLEVRENYSEDYELFSASPDNNPEPDPAANNGNQA